MHSRQEAIGSKRHARAGRRCGAIACGTGMAIAVVTGVAGPPAMAQGRGAVVTAPGAGSSANIDYAGAQALSLPMAATPPPSLRDVLLGPWPQGSATGTPGGSPGRAGDGQPSPLTLAPPRALATADGGNAQPEEFGTAGQPYTTSRVNAQGDFTGRHYPYSAVGKLFFNIGSSTYLCSASLIKRGIVVTAAHCVANFGRQQFYSNWRFVPAYNNGKAPYGTWTAQTATVLTAYYNGSDPCAQTGVICQDDVALITLAPQSGVYAGTRTGWLGYGWNGYSYNGAGQVQIGQIGYPVALDSGALQERTDSQGFTAASLSNNTIIGSLQTGGSSGGPWTVNLGLQPVLAGTSFGSAADHNIVVGVTSWGYIDGSVKQQGASRFTTGNITVLLSAVCGATPAACS